MRVRPSAEGPVHDDHQVQKPPRHRDIGDVRRPYLIRPRYLHATEQIRVDPVPGRRLAGPGAPVDGSEPHDPHQSPDTLPVDFVTLFPQPRRHPPCPIKNGVDKY